MIQYGMGGRAVEGTGLENRQGCKPLVGSNPTPSATFKAAEARVVLNCNIAPGGIAVVPSATATRRRRINPQTGCHSARLRHALFGYIDMAGRKALGAARREAANARQPPHIRRAAGDCIDIAVARLAMHGRGKQTL